EAVSVAGGTMDRLQEILQRDPRLATDTVTRPHELLVTAWRSLVAANGRQREKLCVGFAPAAVWDRAREIFAPFSDRVAGGRPVLVLVGRPRDRSLGEPASRGLASVVDPDASPDEVRLAAH